MQHQRSKFYRLVQSPRQREIADSNAIYLKKVYNEEYREKTNGVKINCRMCGKRVSIANIERHMQTKKCVQFVCDELTRELNE